MSIDIYSNTRIFYNVSYNDTKTNFYFFKGGLTLRQEEPTTDDPEAEFEPDAICKLVLQQS